MILVYTRCVWFFHLFRFFPDVLNLRCPNIWRSSCTSWHLSSALWCHAQHASARLGRVAGGGEEQFVATLTHSSRRPLECGKIYQEIKGNWKSFLFSELKSQNTWERKKFANYNCRDVWQLKLEETHYGNNLETYDTVEKQQFHSFFPVPFGFGEILRHGLEWHGRL